MQTENKLTGKIIRVNKEGWGFISSKEIAFTRIFFHWTALRQDTVTFPELRPGMWVEFTPLQFEGRGYRAVHIRVIEKPAHQESESEDGIPEADVSILHESGQDSD